MNIHGASGRPDRRSIFRAKPGRVRPDALLWQQDLSGRCARIALVGSQRLLVENHTGLLELGDCRIRLNTGCGPMTIEGEDLCLQDVRPDALIVHGCIHRLELPREGGDSAK